MCIQYLYNTPIYWHTLHICN